MPAPLDINLIPQTEVVKQEEGHLVRVSTIVSIVLLVIVLGVGGVVWFNFSQVDSQNKVLLNQLADLRSKIMAQSDVEINARTLDKKYAVLTNVLNSRVYYSLLLREIKVRKPGNLTLTDLEVKGGTAHISGEADTYISISSFVNNLLNDSFVGGNPKLQKLFTAVSLNSVELSETNGRVKFFIVVSFDTSLLKP